MSCGVGHNYGSNPMLLWLWYKTAATAPIRPLAWELTYAADAAIKVKKKKKECISIYHHTGILQKYFLKYNYC